MITSSNSKNSLFAAGILLVVAYTSGSLHAAEPTDKAIKTQLNGWLNADSVAPVLSWDPAAESSLVLSKETGAWRLLPAPGLVQLLIKAQEAEAGSVVQITVGEKENRTYPVTLQNIGWQRMTIAVPMAGWTNGNPGELRLTAIGKTGPIQLAGPSHPAWPTGPSLSDTQLLAKLDLGRPELSGVRAAVLKGDQTEAMRALIQHLRTRSQPIWPERPMEMNAKEKEDLAALAAMNLRGEFAMLGHRHTYLDGSINWHLDPTAGTDAQTHEWVWSISRHEFASRWKYALETTGDARYAAAWARTVLTWTDAMPVPASDWSWSGSGWRVLEAGIRTGEFWPDAWAAFHAQPEFTDTALLSMVKSFWEHADFLAAKPPFTGNFYVLANCGLHTTATLFPEFRDSADWRRIAVANLEKCIVPNTGSDGGWFEGSPSYHQWIVDKLAIVLRCAERNGYASDFPPSFRALLQQMAEWNVRISSPDRLVTSLNDSSRLTLTSVSNPILLDAFPGSEVLPWAAKLAKHDVSGQASPLPTSEYLSPSGYMVMRTSWDKDSSFLLFDVGPMGGGHGHLDALNLVYSADGRRGLFDGTGGTYDKTPFRGWSMSTRSHNTITIDRLDQFRPKPTKEDPNGLLPPETPAPVYKEATDHIYASAWHVGGYGREQQLRAHHRREIVFLKSSGITLVLDTLTPADDLPHAYDLRWHAATTQAKLTADGVALCGEKGSPLLAIMPLTGLDAFHADSAVTKPEILGWDVIKGGTWDRSKSGPPLPALTVRHLRTQQGPTTFATLLVPPKYYATAGKAPTIKRSSSTSATITLGKTVWNVGWSHSPDSSIILSGLPSSGTIRVPRDTSYQSSLSVTTTPKL